MQLLAQFTVTPADFPVFDGQVVHPVCSTYRLGQQLEWGGRLLYLAHRPAGTNAVGTALTLHHRAPAFAGQVVEIWGQQTEWNAKGKLTCQVEARVGNQVICTGQTTQQVLPQDQVQALSTPPSG